MKYETFRKRVIFFSNVPTIFRLILDNRERGKIKNCKEEA